MSIIYPYSACWVIFHAFVVACRLFSKLIFSQTSVRNPFRVSNGLDPDQVQHSDGPDLAPNGFQRISDDKIHRLQEDKAPRVKVPWGQDTILTLIMVNMHIYLDLKI